MAIKLTPTTTVASPTRQVHTMDTILATEGVFLSSSECSFGRCDICLPALADLTDSDPYKNDFFSFIIRVPKGGSIVATLVKCNDDGSVTNTLITDATYGDYYDVGVLKFQIWGFKLKWRNVATAFGFGTYKFNITLKNFAGNDIYNEDSHCFDLKPWSCENEHATVRFEVGQKGYIEDGFDFRDMPLVASPWEQQIRVYGELTRTGRTTETDSVEDSKRRDLQIQSRNFKNWDVRVDWADGIVSKLIIDEMCLASPVKVSGFNQFAVEKYRDVELKYLSSEDPEKMSNDKHEFYVLKFDDYRKATIKRHG